jgi:CubicO group peptidase (beta-lactamase class C family)
LVRLQKQTLLFFANASVKIILKVNAEKFPRTANLLNEGIQQRLHLGGQIFVSLKGHIVADEAVGESTPGRSMHTDDLPLWLSSTKPMTAVAIGQQEEQGRLDWDDPVAQFIPEFAQNGKRQSPFVIS